MPKPRVLLTDDHILLREAFQRLLADDCPVGGVSNALRTMNEDPALAAQAFQAGSVAVSSTPES